MVGMNAAPEVFFFWYFVFALYVLFCTYLGFLMGCALPNAVRRRSLHAFPFTTGRKIPTSLGPFISDVWRALENEFCVFGIQFVFDEHLVSNRRMPLVKKKIEFEMIQKIGAK